MLNADVNVSSQMVWNDWKFAQTRAKSVKGAKESKPKSCKFFTRNSDCLFDWMLNIMLMKILENYRWIHIFEYLLMIVNINYNLFWIQSKYVYLNFPLTVIERICERQFSLSRWNIEGTMSTNEWKREYQN